MSFAAIISCGGDNSTCPAVARNSAGTGTSTMRLTADIDADNALGGFTTDYFVSLRDGLGNRISGATVTYSNSPLFTLTLVETGVSSGDYASMRFGFPAGEFRLDVTRGADNVRSVNLGGPGVHTISAPVNRSIATAGQPLVVFWSVASRAKVAQIETMDLGPIEIADVGTYTIAGPNNPANGS